MPKCPTLEGLAQKKIDISAIYTLVCVFIAFRRHSFQNLSIGIRIGYFRQPFYTDTRHNDTIR